MPLIHWNPLDDDAFFMYDMDPVYEDYLARELSSWPQTEEIELSVQLEEIEGEHVQHPSYVLALA